MRARSWTLLREWCSSRPRAVGLAVGVVLLALLGFLPQLAGPGYEAALVAGLLLPALAAAFSALEALRIERETGGTARDAASRALGQGAAFGSLLAAAGFVTVLLHGARVGFCDPSEGLLLYALGPGVGSALGGLWGGLSGFFAARRRREFRPLARGALAVGLGVFGPLAGILLSLGRFYTSPMVFAFDPFFGVFSGPLYDTIVNVVDRLASYRVGTAATFVAAAAGARLFDDARAGGLRTALRSRPGLGALAAGAALLSAWHSLSGPRLGHWNTSASISEALGASYAGKRCEVIHNKGLAQRDVALFARDCDASLAQVERFFGARGPERVRVFLFGSDAEKGWLMGASRTYIAKPWRDEVYLQAAAYPHPVIAHELAHVVAGRFGRGPFRVAGSWGGLWPDPGRIEGFAVAAAPAVDDELTPGEWAAALVKLELLPRLEQVFEIDFLALNAAKAYTVAGAFVAFVERSHGKEAIRRWYAGEALEAVASGKGLQALEQDFRAELAKTAVPERALLTAQARFERTPFFARRCPRIVDRALGEAGGRLEAGDVAGAVSAYEDVLALDRSNLDARFGLAACARREGELDRALGLYLGLSRAADVPKAIRARALETAGDVELGRTRREQAREHYGAALELTFGEDRQRTLDVKQHVIGSPGERAVTALLIGDPEYGPSWDVAAPLLQAWLDSQAQSDLPAYLLGRNLLLKGRPREGLGYLAQSLERRAALESVRRETLRLTIGAECALGRPEAAKKPLELALSDQKLGAAQREALTALAERCGITEVSKFTRAPAAPEPASSSPGTASSAAPETGAATCPAGMQPIPGGEFWVGSDPNEGFSDDESPRYKTKLAPFCADETEVTAAAYAACVETGACKAPAKTGVHCNFAKSERLEHPMNCLTWDAAQGFCERLGKRLPAEAEFEYLARGGPKAQRYPWGDQSPDGRACWKHNGTCKVKAYPAGAFGLYDVSGNVWEWTADWYGSYPWPPARGFTRVYRGGSFSRRFEKWMHTRLRERTKPDDAGSHLGFRCVLTPEPALCPFGKEGRGCRHGVIERPCPDGTSFNGVRCVKPGEPTCAPGWKETPGHGCVSEKPLAVVVEDPEALLASVTRARSPEFDADCQTHQPERPRAYRFEGGSHAARTLAGKRSGCKNRDVGVGWNSSCCP